MNTHAAIRSVIGHCCLIASCAVLCSIPALAQSLTPSEEWNEEADARGYTAFVTLAATGLSERILLDWAGDEGFIVSFRPAATLLQARVNGRLGLLCKGRPAAAGDVLIRRRKNMIEVAQKGQVLLRAFTGRQPGGIAAAESQATVEDFYLQPAGQLDFNYDFSDLEGTGDTFDILGGEWRIGVYRDPLFQRDHGDFGPFGSSWYQTQEAKGAMAVAGSLAWDRYRARLVTQALPDTRAGLIFYCLDAGNYALFSVRPAGEGEPAVAQLTVIRDGQETLLAKQDVSWDPGTWYELSVRAFDQQAICSISGQEILRAEMPFLTAGQVGFFAEGPGPAKFDDIKVVAVEAAADDFQQAGRLPDCWTPDGGAWAAAKGLLIAKSASEAHCLRTGTDWASPYVEATVAPLKGEAGVCLRGEAGSEYALTVSKTEYRLEKRLGDEITLLASGAAPSAETIPLRLSCQAGRLCAQVADTRELVYDLDIAPAQCGLLARGLARFDDFQAGPVEDTSVEIAAVDATPSYVPGENEGSSRPALGYVWRPLGGSWRPQRGETEPAPLAARPSGDNATGLWYFQPCPGDTRLVAKQVSASEANTFGLAISCEGSAPASGYAAQLDGKGAFTLWRSGQSVGEKTVEVGQPVDMSLERDGNYVIARAASAAIVFRDPDPLPGSRCGAYSKGQTSIARLTLSNRRALRYAFQDVESDWQPAEGEWNTHSGMACIAWDYWLTAAGQPRAFTFNVQRQPRDLHIDTWISEYTLGYADGEHRHFPYHDVSIITCAEKGKADSGYRFVIGADKGTVTRLLRLGKVVAETTDRRFAIVMGGHCNQPRNIHAVVTQFGGAISLRINDVEAIKFTDPEPLGGGFVGLGVYGCTANFRDLWLTPLDGSESRKPSENETPDAP